MARCRTIGLGRAWSRWHLFVGLVVAAGVVGCRAADPPARRAGWMAERKWGVFTHYLAELVCAEDGRPPPRPVEALTPEEWNRTVDGFDVAALARRLHECGAGYYVITVGQNSGYYCAPNPVYDQLVGERTSHCSRRDLVRDLAAGLRPYGIRLLVYLPSGPPEKDVAATRRLGWNEVDPRRTAFQRNWERVIAQWSRQWGTDVSGWWFDGCYFGAAMYDFPDAPNWQSFASAARAGNPGAVVAFNRGIQKRLWSDAVVWDGTDAGDYTAGEVRRPLGVSCDPAAVHGAQWHMLSFLGGEWWHGTRPRFSDEQVVQRTRSIVAAGGIVTWDVHIDRDGSIPAPLTAQLRVLGTAMAAVRSGAAAPQPALQEGVRP